MANASIVEKRNAQNEFFRDRVLIEFGSTLRFSRRCTDQLAACIPTDPERVNSVQFFDEENPKQRESKMMREEAFMTHNRRCATDETDCN